MFYLSFQYILVSISKLRKKINLQVSVYKIYHFQSVEVPKIWRVLKYLCLKCQFLVEVIINYQIYLFHFHFTFNLVPGWYRCGKYFYEFIRRSYWKSKIKSLRRSFQNNLKLLYENIENIISRYQIITKLQPLCIFLDKWNR